MSEVKRIPYAAMSQKERDIYHGEWKDLSEERKQFAKDFAEDAHFTAMYDLIFKLTEAQAKIGCAEVLLCSKEHEKKAVIIAKELGLEGVFINPFPFKKFFVIKKSMVKQIVEQELNRSHDRLAAFNQLKQTKDYSFANIIDQYGRTIRKDRQ